MEEKGKAELESHQPLILFSELQILGHTGSTLVSFTSVVPDIVSHVWKEPTHLVQLQGMITNYINYKIPKGRTLYVWLYKHTLESNHMGIFSHQLWEQLQKFSNCTSKWVLCILYYFI